MTTLPASPPGQTVAVVREGDRGWPAFAVQRGLNTLGDRLDPDGIYGPATLAAVEAFQRRRRLAVDGIAGPATQAALVRDMDEFTHDHNRGLPAGLIRGFAEAEGGNLLAAVNWSVPGGVDCGVMQIRVYGPPFQPRALRYAFAPGAAMQRTAAAFLDRYMAYRRLAYASRQPREWALRCAALAHNFPWAAEKYARYGKLPNPNKPAPWVPAGTRFRDGTPVRTYDDWCRFYALGGPHGEGRVTRYIQEW